MVARTPSPAPEPRYRIVCYELENDHQTVVLDTTARGYIVATATIAPDGRMQGHAAAAGPAAMRKRIAQLIADDDLLTR